MPFSKIASICVEFRFMSLVPRQALWFCLATVLSLVLCAGRLEANTLHVMDLQGYPVERLNTGGSRVVVLVFAATDCPISNRYIPEIERLNQELASSSVTFWWVFPDPEDTLSTVRKHARDFSISVPSLIDQQQDLVRMAHVTVTPEVAVFAVKDGSLHEVYHGRIDDRYLAFGQERPQASQHDLKQVLDAVLTGSRIPPPAGNPVGCSIVPATPKP